jgi:hypothetical protein
MQQNRTGRFIDVHTLPFRFFGISYNDIISLGTSLPVEYKIECHGLVLRKNRNINEDC